MKRILFIVPILLFLLLNACGGTFSSISPDTGTAVAKTQTAAIWTPTIVPTHAPSESKIVEWINASLNADSLEQTLDAKYEVVNASFPQPTGGSITLFRIDVRCECANNSQCCTPQRTFVVTMNAMQQSGKKIVEEAPSTVAQVKVVCFDHLTAVGAMNADWSNVKAYLLGNIDGFQFGARTTPGPPP